MPSRIRSGGCRLAAHVPLITAVTSCLAVLATRPSMLRRVIPSAASVEVRGRLEALRPLRFRVLHREMAVPGPLAAPTGILRQQGFEVLQQGDRPLEPDPAEVVLVWGNAVWFPQAVRSLQRMPRESRPLTVIWHVEPLPPPRDSGLRWPRLTVREIAKILLRDPRANDVYSNVRMLERLARHALPDILAVSTRERYAFLLERGFDVVLAGPGYEPRDGRDLGIERDLDVLFLGSTNVPARRRALRRLRRAGVRIEVRGSYSDGSLWGEGRTLLLNRTKIVLSIARFPGTFGSRRFVIAMACKALVVSDPLYDPYPFQPDVHFVEASLEDMPAVIERYLADEDARARVAAQGHDFVTQELAMERVILRLLAAVGERVAER